ncbi:MAG: hypothetical protein GKR89_10415 [Candidatus Latescibacteria bacterium]|nr:hypothetical protein [Candidatus Latescibacterota bacterium]
MRTRFRLREPLPLARPASLWCRPIKPVTTNPKKPAAFPQEADQRAGAAVIDSSTYGRAIAAYERELVTRNSPYDRFVEGDDQALTPFQKRGLVLFFTKAKCAACHNGPMFNDFRFILQGVPQEGGQGRDRRRRYRARGIHPGSGRSLRLPQFDPAQYCIDRALYARRGLFHIGRGRAILQ